MGFEKNFLLLFCLLEAVDVAVSSPAPYDAEKVVPSSAKRRPPEFMLQLYSDATFSAKAREPPYGATSVTAIGVTKGRGSSFLFTLPPSFQIGELVESELHLHHSSLHHRTAVNDTLMVRVHAEGFGEVARQIAYGNSAGWLRFRLGTEFLKDLCGNDKCASPQLALDVLVSTLDGQEIKIKLHHGVMNSDRKPLFIFFAKQLNKLEDTFNALKNSITQKSRDRRSVADSILFNESTPIIPGSCERRPMKVNFEKIGWSYWVVYPSDYNAYTCSGSCGFPLGQHLNPTNHAIIQTLVGILDKKVADLSSMCVPSQYSPLSMLYYDEAGRVIFRYYDDMVVESCGCR